MHKPTKPHNLLVWNHATDEELLQLLSATMQIHMQDGHTETALVFQIAMQRIESLARDNATLKSDLHEADQRAFKYEL